MDISDARGEGLGEASGDGFGNGAGDAFGCSSCSVDEVEASTPVMS